MDHKESRRGESNLDALYTIAARLNSSIVNKGLLLALTLVVMDVLLMAHYQGPAALTILRYTPPIALFTGIASNLLPLLLPLSVVGGLAAAVTTFSSNPDGRQIRRGFNMLALAGVSTVGMMLFVDRAIRPSFWLLSLILLLGSISVWVHHKSQKRAGSHEGDSDFKPLVAALMTALLLGQVAGNTSLKRAISTPFVPAERVAVAHEPPKTAYVLDSSSEWTTLLIDSTRRIEIVRTKDVTHREVCSVLGSGAVRPAWALAQSGTPSPPCTK